MIGLDFYCFLNVLREELVEEYLWSFESVVILLVNYFCGSKMRVDWGCKWLIFFKIDVF